MTYTPDEELLLTMLPAEIGSAVAFSGKSGPIGTVKEMLANTKAAVDGAKSLPNNSIVQIVAPSVDDRPEAMERAKEIRDQQIDRLKAAGITTREQMLDATLVDARTVAELLENADPTEAAEYKDWVMSIGMAVAEAAKEGGFLGLGGEQVSEGEESMLAQIREALRA